jgi:hypothetical protein
MEVVQFALFAGCLYGVFSYQEHSLGLRPASQKELADVRERSRWVHFVASNRRIVRLTGAIIGAVGAEWAFPAGFTHSIYLPAFLLMLLGVVLGISSVFWRGLPGGGES